MSPVYGLWLGLILVYFVVTGKAEMTVTGFNQLLHGKLKGAKRGEVKK